MRRFVSPLAASIRSRPALVLRIALLAVSLFLAVLGRLPATDLSWLVAVLVTAALSTITERDVSQGTNGSTAISTTTRLAEGLVTAVAVIATGQQASPVLPYLVAPVFAAGLAAGGKAAAITTSIEALGLIAGLPVVLSRVNPGEFGLVAIEWLLIALLTGLVAAWARKLMQTAGTAETASYERAHRLLSKLYTITRQLPGSLDPVTIAAALLDELAAVTPYEHAAVLVRSGGDRLIPLTHRGQERLAWDISLRGDNPFARAWATEQPQLYDGRFPPEAEPPPGSPKTGCAMVLPLSMGMNLLGLVAIETWRIAAYGEDSLAVAAEVANQSALKLQTGLLFDEVRELATAEERRRLAREIHDGIAQELASLGYAVDDLAVAAAEHETLTEDLSKLRQQITRLVRELRLSIFELRTEVDGHGGLGAALSDYLRTVGTSSDLTVHLTLDEAARRLPAETEAELLRIVQEAVTNARKHATADNLWVTCHVDPPGARLVVEDDGRGIGPRRQDSFGLEIMRERAARIGASFHVLPREQGGTRVEVALGPTPPKADAPAATTAVR